MKKVILLFISFICLLSSGCRSEIAEAIAQQKVSSRIIARASSTETTDKRDTKGEVVFKGEDILWFNETTKELRFTDNFSKKTILLSNEAIHFFIDDDYLFTSMIYASSLGTQVINSLVLYYNIVENKYFLLEGYPSIDVLTNLDYNAPTISDTFDKDMTEFAQASRIENMQMIESEWDQFVNQLKQEGRLKN